MARPKSPVAAQVEPVNRITEHLDGTQPLAKRNGEGRKATKSPDLIVIPPLNDRILQVKIDGTAPLIIRAWDQKTMQILEDKQIGKRQVKGREAVDPKAVFNGARYISEQGWDGFPAGGFRAAMIAAVRALNMSKSDFSMVAAKMTIFIIADGFDKLTKRQLVRINGKPEVFKCMQPTSGGGPYMSYRPRYFPWSATLNIRYNANLLNEQNIINLLSTAGAYCGVGEHRPTSPESLTGENGLWTIDPKKNRFVSLTK